MKKFIVPALAASVLVLAACGGGGEKAGDVGEKVLENGQTVAELMHERHENFEEIGKSFKAIRDQLDKETPDMEKISAAADLIAGYAGEVDGWFPEGTGPETGIKTDALATVWEKPEEFEAAIAKFKAAATGMKMAADSGDVSAIKAAVQPLGASCKNCHDNFRLDD